MLATDKKPLSEKRTKIFTMTENTIHLNLKRKWFDMILSGDKTEEYRDIKPFYDKRFEPLFPTIIRNEVYYPIIDTITFSNGYAKDRPQFVVKIKEIEKNTGKTFWGAELGKRYYVFHLGEIIKAGRQGFHFNVTKEMPLEMIVESLKL
mgnify:CR=1 FL=1